ncbi:MAG: lamin tail domain-containing protein [Bacteroidota bacterium]|nr:lamin tail domain-containing protein [Bacteroidota bacterium]
MKKIIIIFLFLIPIISFSQVIDNFEDGNISDWTQSQAGHWAASTDNPLNGSYSLHHIFDNSSGDYEMISHNFEISLDTIDVEWRFQIKHGYSPSSSNNWSFFLVSDKDANEMHPNGSVNGYAIGVDYSGSDDIIKLWKISGSNEVVVINTGFNWQDNNLSSTAVGFKITRASNGDWEIFIDQDGGFDNLTKIGATVNNVDYTDSKYFGFYYEYSSTQDRELWIDDVYPILPDISSPELSDLQVISPSQIKLIFTENIDETTAQTVTNYLVDNSIGNPTSATIDGGDAKIVDLVFSSNLLENINYSMDLSNIEDIAENIIKDTSVAFIWENIKAVSVSSISTTEINVIFSKDVDETIAEDINNYSIDNGIGTAISATLDAVDKTLVHLTFSTAMTNNQSYNLNIQNIEDLNGNAITTADFPFTYHTVQEFDIVVNELMIDVYPEPVGLPENKYIELYNTSDFDIDLTDWTITIGTNSAKTFPAITIEAHGFVIICDSDVENFFDNYATVAPILTESHLTSTIGKNILIKNSKDEKIYEFIYSTDWYNDDEKDDGGWSMERIDPNNICNQQNNWHASEDYRGGTPGAENSVFASNPDNTAPIVTFFITSTSEDIAIHFSEIVDESIAELPSSYLLNSSVNPESVTVENDEYTIVNLHFASHFEFGSNNLKITNIQDNCGNLMNDTIFSFTYQLINPLAVIPMSSTQIKIIFSESVTIASAENESNYSVDDGIANPTYVSRDFTDYSIVHLIFNEAFEEDKEYTITVSGVSDLNGNYMEETNLKFTYHITKANDLLINEILYNPKTDCSDFVELYNNSGFPINLENIRIAKRNSAGELDYDYNLTYSYSTLKPDSFVVITEDTLNIQQNYTTGNNFLQLSSMPSYSDDEGTIVIIDEKDTIIDEFFYNDDMQFSLLTSTDGVSLERISYKQATQDSSNWHSAAQNVGYATPGLKNSQYRDVTNDSIIGNISLNEQVFSPDNDGYNDQLYIYYDLEQNGYIADVLIFDKNGFLVRKLVSNQLLSVNGNWIWDGLDDNMRKVKIGIYAIVIKVYDLTGKVHLYRKAAVVSAKR